jgi:hypothetical protein
MDREPVLSPTLRGNVSFPKGPASLSPQIPVHGAVLDRFADMLRGNLIHAREIGNSAPKFKNSVIRSGAQIQFLHGHPKHSFASFVQLAVSADHLRTHPCIAADF